MEFDANERWADVVEWSLPAFLVTVFLLVTVDCDISEDYGGRDGHNVEPRRNFV